MAAVALKINDVKNNVVKKMVFKRSSLTDEVCSIIIEKIADSSVRKPEEYGLFVNSGDGRGMWYESGKTLEYYILGHGEPDMVEFRKKVIPLKVRMMDGTVKTVMIDESLIILKVMDLICEKIGIVNQDEYSLLREDDEKEKTLTLSKTRDYKKMDEMRKKLHTDDDLNWLDHNKTLREQGIDPAEILLLRRKYFFSDQNVDTSDPIQLNLLYVQTRDAILKGAHPVSLDEAIIFAGIQCQIQYGDHVESKHKPGFLDSRLKDFLPKEYTKLKGIEKRIFGEHKKYFGKGEVEAKAEYVRSARSLKTYGITFFLVKEKETGKNKLVPRLLGITKDSIVRVDERTKQIIETWPLTSVKQWCATTNAFHINFGDYARGTYIGKTDEGANIAKLVSGYIDIILKKQAAKDHFGIEGDEEAAMYEESVGPSKALIVQHKVSKVGHGDTGSVALPGVLRAGDTSGQAQFSSANLQNAHFSQMSQFAHRGHMMPTGMSAESHGLGQAQRALLGTISEGLSVVEEVQVGLDRRPELPNLGSDATSQKWIEMTKDMSCQKVGSELSAMNAAAAQVVSLTTRDEDEEPNYAGIGSALQTMTYNLDEFSKDVRMLAALCESESNGMKLLGAARFLADAISGLMDCAQQGIGTPEEQQKIRTAATRIGEASNQILHQVAPDEKLEMLFRQELVGLAKNTVMASARMVLKARNIASKCTDTQDVNVIVSGATTLALTADQLLTCTQVLAPTIDSLECQAQLEDAIKCLAIAVDQNVHNAENICEDMATFEDLVGAANEVTNSFEALIRHFKKGTGVTDEIEQIDAVVATTDALLSSMDNPNEALFQARNLTDISSMLVNGLQANADSEKDPEQRNKLLAAARLLTNAMTNMMDAARGYGASPHAAEQQQQLKTATEELRLATNMAAASAWKNKISSNLQQAVKHAASTATQLVNMSSVAGKSNNNPSSQHPLAAQCKIVSDEIIPRVVESMRNAVKYPDSPKVMSQLISAAQGMIQPCNKMVALAKAVVPTVTDQSSVIGLSGATKNLTIALIKLHSALNRTQEICGSSELDGAIDQLQTLKQELLDIRQSVTSGMLRPLPGETAEVCAAQMGSSNRAVGSSIAQLLTAVAQHNDDYIGNAARENFNALRVLAGAVRGVAATTSDTGLRGKIIDCAIDVIAKSTDLMEGVQEVASDPENPENNSRLAQSAKGVSSALNNCINCLPGLQDIDQATKQVSSLAMKLMEPQKFPVSDWHYNEIQLHLNSRAADLNEAAKNILTIASQNAPQLLAPASNHFRKACENFVESGMEVAGATKDPAAQSRIVTDLRGVSMMSSKLLLATKSLVIDPNTPNVKNLLAQAARAVTESINQLINVCTDSAPGQKECDSAYREMQMMLPLLGNPNESVTDGTYSDCLDSIIDKSKSLAESITGITASAKQGDLNTFKNAVSKFADTVCGMAEHAAQAAYLVGVADPASEPGSKGIINQSQVCKASQAIQSACQVLSNPTSTSQQAHHMIAVLADNTTTLCNLFRDAATKTTNPVAKKQFVQSARDLANSTANIVRSFKATGGKISEADKTFVNCIPPLLQTLETLTNFASSAEFVSTPAKISDQARKAQEPIMEAGQTVVEGSSKLIQAAKLLATNPKDPSTYQAYSAQSHNVSEAIKRIVMAIRESSPGFKECDNAVEQITISIDHLDHAVLAAVNHYLSAPNDGPLQSFQEQVITSAKQLLDHANHIRKAAKGEDENLGHKVSSAVSYLEPLKLGAIGCAAKTVNSKLQMSVLEQSKTVLESMQHLILSAKEAGGNRKATDAHVLVDEAANGATEVLQELIQTMEESASASGFVNALVDNLNKFISMINEVDQAAEVPFVECQTNMVHLAQQLARTGQEMMTMSVTRAQELGPLANTLTKDYATLASQCRAAVAASSNNQVGGRIKSTVQQLGTSCISLVQVAGQLQCNPTDNFAKTDLAGKAKKVIENVSSVLSALQVGARGTQACINAANTISGIVADLDTTVMFASTGTLDADSQESFADVREQILKSAKVLVEDTKKLVAGASASQEQLASSAQEAITSISRLANFIKHGATLLGSHQSEAQVLLLNAVKDVASALSDLIVATKNAAGQSASEPAVAKLKDTAKVMVTNITSLLKTVKTVEDEASRGTQALEASIEAIGQELKSHHSNVDRVEKTVSPDELVRLTKPITIATSKAVAAGNSCQQEDIIVAANMGRKVISDLLRACKGSVAAVDDSNLQKQVLEAGNVCGSSYQQLLQAVHMNVQRPTQENKQKFIILSKNVANAVTELVHIAEAMKGSEWADPCDPTVIAETELLNAASSIEAAAKKLASLRPRLRPKEANEDLTFEEQILEACNSIANATGALVKAASAAQRELVAQGKIGAVQEDQEDDSQWSQGLISAARLVTAATHSLCDAANAMIQGQASEEKLISSAKQVAASTAHLLVACKVKADPNSAAMNRLQGAGNAVKRATEALVREAQKSKAPMDDETNVQVNQRMVSGMAQIIMAQEEILKKEKELELARRKLEHIRKAKYRPDGDGTGSEL